jgi:hypothetical protein
MVFVNQLFLRDAEVSLPRAFADEMLCWRRIRGREPTAWAACAPQDTASRLLDSWGEMLQEKAAAALAADLPNFWERAGRLADLGLCAARDEGLRWRLYLRLGAALSFSPTPERIRRLFDLFIAPRYPDRTWERYLQEMAGLAEVVRKVRNQLQEARVTGTGMAPAILRKFHGIAGQRRAG